MREGGWRGEEGPGTRKTLIRVQTGWKLSEKDMIIDGRYDNAGA